MDSVVLVKGWKKGANWSFPRGKINKDEDDLDCAVREVYEETGLDLRAAGLVPTERKPRFIELPMREQQLRLYMFRDIPMDTKFQPRTRKEISKIQWYKLSELPAFRKKGGQNQNDNGPGPAVNKFYMVAPFLVPLKKWIYSQKKLDEKRAVSGAHGLLPHHLAADDVVTTEDDTWAPGYSEQQSHVPAIETLDGATRELQRLLKMQPPTQGLQSAPQEDKGTALLSILQSNSARTAPPMHQNAPLPHTSFDAAISELRQPRNPHHHTNLNPIHVLSQQPPPSFPFAPDHGNISWNQNQPPTLAHQTRNAPQFYPDMAGQQPPLPHPHGQPPQAQGLMPQNGLFQDQAASQHSSALHNIHLSPVHGQGQLPGQQNSQLPTGPGSAKLSGASLALLSAFKRDTGSDQNAPTAGHAAQPGSHSSPYLDHRVPGGSLNQSGETSGRGPAEQANVSELVGSSVQPKGDPHRSALLGMFKKSPSEASAHQSQGGSQQENHPTNIAQYPGQLRQPENMLLQQLQGSRVPANQQLSLEQLSIQPKKTQSPVPTYRGENPSPYQYHQSQYSQQQQTIRSPFAPSPGQQPQPPRILQRGQRFEDFASPAGQQPGPSPKTSPFVAHHVAQGVPGSAPGPSVGHSNADQTQRQEAPREQKKQLLSLFGKQAATGDVAPVSGMEPANAGDLPRSRVSSMASKGGETPISPAEQTFLLDYLQSVTNNAGRR